MEHGTCQIDLFVSIVVAVVVVVGGGGVLGVVGVVGAVVVAVVAVVAAVVAVAVAVAVAVVVVVVVVVVSEIRIPSAQSTCLPWHFSYNLSPHRILYRIHGRSYCHHHHHHDHHHQHNHHCGQFHQHYQHHSNEHVALHPRPPHHIMVHFWLKLMVRVWTYSTHAAEMIYSEPIMRLPKAMALGREQS